MVEATVSEAATTALRDAAVDSRPRAPSQRSERAAPATTAAWPAAEPAPLSDDITRTAKLLPVADGGIRDEPGPWVAAKCRSSAWALLS